MTAMGIPPVQLSLPLGQNLKAGAIAEVDSLGRFVAADLSAKEDGPYMLYVLLRGGLAGEYATGAATTPEYIFSQPS